MPNPSLRATVLHGFQRVFLGEGTRQTPFPMLEDLAEPLLRMGVFQAGWSHFGPTMRIEREGHGFHLLFVVLKGGAVVEWDGGAQSMEPGSVWLLPARTRYCYHAGESGWEALWFHLSDQRFRPELSGTAVVRGPWFPERLESMAEGFLFECGVGALDSPVPAVAYATLIAHTVERIFAGFDAGERSRKRVVLDRVWSEVAGSLGHPWTVEAIAARTYVSVTHLYRLMHQHYGVKPQDLLRRLRMQKARELLLIPDTTLEWIAREVGYACPFSFSKAFKRQTGVSPSDFRSR